MAVALIVGSHLFIQKTRLGRAMRATFQDTEMARLTGVDVDRIYMATFAFGAALAGASGALAGGDLLGLSGHGRSGRRSSPSRW